MENTDIKENESIKEEIDLDKQSEEKESRENTKEENDEVEVEEILSEDVKQQYHESAISFKEQGNDRFKASEYIEAQELYTLGIKICPKSFTKTLSQLLSNRAACYIKKDEKELAVEDCNKALTYDSHYTRARLRRAQMLEETEKLEEALADYNEILKYDPKCQQAGQAAMRLPAEINARNEKLKEEMMGKLKDLGNMCLKPFGLSTNNFKFNQDPNTGGYSVNFQQ